MLKGRQTGGMHRGHGWVFRAESRETMLAWYEDIKNLTEKTGEERNAFVRKHARSFSAGSHKAGSISSEGALDEDEADHVPYSATTSQFEQEPTLLKRPQPGGRFPSDINVNRDLRVPLSPSSGASSDDHESLAAGTPFPRPEPTHFRQEGRGFQQEEQEAKLEGRGHESSIKSADERGVEASTTHNLTSTSPSKLSSHQAQQNAGEPMLYSGLASTRNGEFFETNRNEAISSIPLRLSSFQAQYDKENASEEARPKELVRTISDDPDTVAAAMGLPGTNFPYVRSNDQPRPKEGDLNQSGSEAGNPAVIGYFHPANHQEITQKVPERKLDSRRISSSIPHQNATSTAADENINKSVSLQLAVPAKFSEYCNQAVQAQGGSSDTAEGVAYAQQQKSQGDPPATPDESLRIQSTNANSTGAAVTKTETTLDDVTELEADNNHRGMNAQATKPLRIDSPAEFEIEAALDQYREGWQNDPKLQQLTPNLKSPYETTSSDPIPPATTSIIGNSEEAPILTPVELGQFGSTPKQPETSNFETSFTSGTVESPIAPLSATIGNNSNDVMSQRPPLSSHVTISDLHVPGEFPYSPQA